MLARAIEEGDVRRAWGGTWFEVSVCIRAAALPQLEATAATALGHYAVLSKRPTMDQKKKQQRIIAALQKGESSKETGLELVMGAPSMLLDNKRIEDIRHLYHVHCNIKDMAEDVSRMPVMKAANALRSMLVDISVGRMERAGVIEPPQVPAQTAATRQPTQLAMPSFVLVPPSGLQGPSARGGAAAAAAAGGQREKKRRNSEANEASSAMSPPPKSAAAAASAATVPGAAAPGAAGEQPREGEDEVDGTGDVRMGPEEDPATVAAAAVAAAAAAAAEVTEGLVGAGWAQAAAAAAAPNRMDMLQQQQGTEAAEMQTRHEKEYQQLVQTQEVAAAQVCEGWQHVGELEKQHMKEKVELQEQQKHEREKISSRHATECTMMETHMEAMGLHNLGGAAAAAGGNGAAAGGSGAAGGDAAEAWPIC
jgi:hypothetical protein